MRFQDRDSDAWFGVESSAVLESSLRYVGFKSV